MCIRDYLFVLTGGYCDTVITLGSCLNILRMLLARVPRLRKKIATTEVMVTLVQVSIHILLCCMTTLSGVVVSRATKVD